MEAYQAKSTESYDNLILVDSDSKTVGIDNRCSACISCDLEDFEGDVHDTNVSIKGFGGVLDTAVKKGTIKWTWTNNQGVPHTFRIPNSYYVPHPKHRLLSPQHWAQTQKDKVPGGTGCDTTSKACKLYWNGKKEELEVPYDKTSNVATFCLAPGFNQFASFCTVIQPLAMTAEVSDDEEEDDNQPAAVSERENQTTWQDQWPSTTPISTDFDLNARNTVPNSAPIVVEQDEEETTKSSDSEELLRYHQKFNHISMAKLQLLAKEGTIPKRLAKCKIPLCTACMYAKAQRTPWRHKRRKNHKPIRPPTKPGQVVSVDQLKSPTPGLVAQLTGSLTRQRYNYATVFVDHFSGLGYVYLQKTQAAEETLQAKLAFERHAATRGVTV
ncbi:MAG: hypothetical protein AAGM67_07855, partial [Bacteroidota bacterium]